MCIHPRLFPNPWYFPSSRRSEMERHLSTWFLHDTTNAFMKVPCGCCPECLKARQNEFVQRIVEMSKFNYTYFGTLTYNNKSLPFFYANGFKISYAEKRDFQLFIRRLKNSGIIPDFRYFGVTEYGSDENKTHRPHFHFLLFIPYEYRKGEIDFYKGYEYQERVLNFILSSSGWARNYGTRLDPLYIPISDFITRFNKSTYDFHLVDGDSDKVGFYVSKYILKFSDYVNRVQSALRLNLDISTYWDLWSKFRPKILCSKGLGIKIFNDWAVPYSPMDNQINADIVSMIDYSSRNENYPRYYMGNSFFPMSKYFINRCASMENLVKFHNNKFPDDGPFKDESKEEEFFADDMVSFVDKNLDKFEKFRTLQSRLQQNKY